MLGTLQDLGWPCSTCQQSETGKHCCRYTIIKNGRQRLYMPNSKFLTSEFMVMDGKKQERGRGFGSRYSDQPDSGTRPDLTRPLGPGMAYGGWGEELERQRIMAASRCLCPVAAIALCHYHFPSHRLSFCYVPHCCCLSHVICTCICTGVSVNWCQCQLVPVLNKLQLGCRRTVPPGAPPDDQAQRPPSRQGTGPGPPQAPGAQQANGSGNGSEHHTNGSQHTNGEFNAQGAQENGAQQKEAPPGFIPPYRGIPGYYSYGAYPGAPYDPSTQDQYLYQYNYNALHPYWRSAYLTDEDEAWEERSE